MTTYVIRQVRIQVSDQQNGEGLTIKRGDRETKFSADANLNESMLNKYVLAAPATDEDLLEGSTISAGRILYIECDREITIKLNTTVETGIVVKPINSSSPGVLYYEGEFTHVYVTLAGTVDANIVIGVVGA